MKNKERIIDRVLTYEFRVGSVAFQAIDFLFAVCLWIFALVIRLKLYPIESADYYGFLEPWMDQIRELGYFRSLGTQISNYTSPYMYLMCLVAVLTKDSLAGLKTVSVVFDLAASIAMFLIVYRLTENVRRSILGMALLLLSPTVIIDSAWWCQCDIIYTCFILFGLWFLLGDSSRGCLIMIGIAFSFKLQTLFIVPFLIILWLKEYTVKFRHFLYVPLVYVVSAIPAWLFGRSFRDLMTIYFDQGSYYPWGTLEYPNVYAFLDEVMPGGHYMKEVSGAGTFLTIILLGLLAYCIYTEKVRLTGEIVVTLALFSVAGIVYLLPHMHDRYGFLIDLLAIVYVMLRPKKFPVMCGFFLISVFTFMPYLIAVHIFSLQTAAVVQLGLIVYVGYDLFAQIKASREDAS